MDMGLDFLVILVVAASIAIAFTRMLIRQDGARRIGASVTFQAGNYVAGLPNRARPMNNVSCAVGPSSLVFTGAFGGRIGQIPRDSIQTVSLDDKSQITQRLTATRLAILGPLALAVPKKKKIEEYWIVVEWIDRSGGQVDTIFEFTGGAARRTATRAITEMRRAMVRAPVKEAPAEKLCPFCAETIKAVAIKCRYCGSEVPG